MGCMADATGGHIDTCIEIVTPENIAFQYRVAGPFRRLPAFLIDAAIRIALAAVTMIAAVFAFDYAGVVGVGIGIGLLIWFALSWFYMGLFEALWNRQTPGKRIMRIRVARGKSGRLFTFTARATTTWSNSPSARRTMSQCPFVMGSKVPG